MGQRIVNFNNIKVCAAGAFIPHEHMPCLTSVESNHTAKCSTALIVLQCTHHAHRLIQIREGDVGGEVGVGVGGALVKHAD